MGGVREFYERIGKVGEDLVTDILQPLAPVERSHNGADLVWRGVEIEVKTARAHRYRECNRRGYQFCLRRDGHTDVGHADIACLVCLPNYPKLSGSVFFWIPVDRLPGMKLTIPNHPLLYDGRWAKYVDRWDLLEEIALQKEAESTAIVSTVELAVPAVQPAVLAQ